MHASIRTYNHMHAHIKGMRFLPDVAQAGYTYIHIHTYTCTHQGYEVPASLRTGEIYTFIKAVPTSGVWNKDLDRKHLLTKWRRWESMTLGGRAHGEIILQVCANV